MKNSDMHTYMVECAAEAARVAQGVVPEQLDRPSHSAGWDVRTLVNHWVLYTSHGLEHRALREELPEELVQRDFTADADWARAYAGQLDRAVAAWADPAVWEGEMDLGGAAMPAAYIAAMNILEMALHGWDVAVATGQEYRVSEGVARFLLEAVEENAGLYRQYDGFADPVQVPGDASVFDRALAASGRDPRQTAVAPSAGA